MRYAGRHFVRQRIWRLGRHVEVDVYPVFQAPGQRMKRCRPTREAQRLINQRDAANKARRLILANFSDPGSMEVDLTFGRPALEAEATETLKKYIRALRMAYAGNGAVLRYMYAKEQGRRGGKWHVHLMLSPGITRERAEELWTEGFANSRRLRIDETGLAGLAEYVLKEGKKRKPEDKGKRRWSCSRNLIRPEPEVTDGEVTVSEVWDLADAIERGAPLPKVYMACGLRDSLFGVNMIFQRYLSKQPVHLTWRTSPDAHTWTFWTKQLYQVMEWLQKQ